MGYSEKYISTYQITRPTFRQSTLRQWKPNSRETQFHQPSIIGHAAALILQAMTSFYARHAITLYNLLAPRQTLILSIR